MEHDREPRHDTVLLEETVDGLEIKEDDVVVDATLGGAGHFREALKRLGPDGVLVGIDADADALVRAQAVVDELPEGERPTVHLVNGNFRDLGTILDDLKLVPTKVMFDLGWSAFHLTSGRGFSFKTDEPLLMTYGDPEEGTTAPLVARRRAVREVDREVRRRAARGGADCDHDAARRSHRGGNAVLVPAPPHPSGHEDLPGAPYRRQRRARRAP